VLVLLVPGVVFAGRVSGGGVSMKAQYIFPVLSSVTRHLPSARHCSIERFGHAGSVADELVEVVVLAGTHLPFCTMQRETKSSHASGIRRSHGIDPVVVFVLFPPVGF
jgi:hypothetical protein